VGHAGSRKYVTLRSKLLASTSFASLIAAPALLGLAATTPAYASCTVRITSDSGPVTNSVAIDCISIGGLATVTGNVTNNSTITPTAPGSTTGISVGQATINGAIVNSGTITSAGSGILVDTGASVSQGITNGGTISALAPFAGIALTAGSTFAGGIDNTGKVSAGTGMALDVDNFSGGITNSGTVSGTHNGIDITGSTFIGGITNNGTITGANFNAIQINDTSTFSGGITNGGTLSGNIYGIYLSSVQTFTGLVSNSGVITGNIGIEILHTPGISIFNSGTITGTSGVAIQFDTGPNTLTLGPGSVINGEVLGTGNDTFKLGGSGDGNFDLGTIGNSQQYHGFTTFSEAGAGTWTVTGTFGQTSPWTVESGTLVVNGDLSSASSLTVNGGVLAGTGTVGNTMIKNGGTFAPGTPGTSGTSMTVSGNLAFQSSAIYFVQVDPTSATSANVTGTASLAGNVLAGFAPGSYLAKQYTILHSGSLGGTTFATLGTTNLPAGFIASLSYTNADVQLNLTANLGGSGGDNGNSGGANANPADPPDPATVAPGGLNGNQRNVASSLNNFFNGGGTLTPNFVSIFGLTGGNLTSALSQLSGEAAADGEQGAFRMMTSFLGLMLDPSVDGRNGSGDGQASGFATEHQASFPPDVALAYDAVVKSSRRVAFDQRWSAWGSGYGGSSTTNGNATAGSNDVTARTYGFAAGMDYHATPDTVLGFALAGGGTNWGLAQGLGGGRSDAFQAGVYGATHAGPAYLAAAFAFTNHWMTIDRFAFGGDSLSARFNAQSYGGRLEAGYRLGTPDIGMSPYAAVQAQDFHTPSYNETDLTGGGFGLSYGSATATDTRSELGSRFDTLTAFGGMPLMLRARAAWAHDWVSNPAIGAAFQALPGASFTVNGAAPPRNSALASAGAELHLTPALSLAAKFDGEFARGSQTYAGTGTLRYSW
jgi:uncharacterized protein with beta-barrel porin domain